MKEKRIYPRAQASIPVSIKYNNYKTIITSKNISDDGVYLVKDPETQFPPAGSIIDVEVMGIMGNSPVVTTATIIRITDDGVGLKFQNPLFTSASETAS